MATAKVELCNACAAKLRALKVVKPGHGVQEVRDVIFACSTCRPRLPRELRTGDWLDWYRSGRGN